MNTTLEIILATACFIQLSGLVALCWALAIRKAPTEGQLYEEISALKIAMCNANRGKKAREKQIHTSDATAEALLIMYEDEKRLRELMLDLTAETHSYMVNELEKALDENNALSDALAELTGEL